MKRKTSLTKRTNKNFEAKTKRNENLEAKKCENMRNFVFIFSHQEAKTKRNEIPFRFGSEITKKNLKRNGRTLG